MDRHRARSNSFDVHAIVSSCRFHERTGGSSGTSPQREPAKEGLDIRSTAQKNHTVSTAFETIEKKKNTNNETSSSTCGQQCIMNRQEHNLSLELDVAWKKKDPTSVRVPQKWTIPVIVDKLSRTEFMSITFSLIQNLTSCINYGYYGFNYFENKIYVCNRFQQDGTHSTSRENLAFLGDGKRPSRRPAQARDQCRHQSRWSTLPNRPVTSWKCGGRTTSLIVDNPKSVSYFPSFLPHKEGRSLFPSPGPETYTVSRPRQLDETHVVLPAVSLEHGIANQTETGIPQILPCLH